VNITIVVPTIREDCALRWLEEWRDDLADARIILVEDNPEPTFALLGVEHYCWKDFPGTLGKNAWTIPRRTSACRSYGFLKALESDTDIIWTTDDDCYPEVDKRGHYLELLEKAFNSSVQENAWWNTIGNTGLHPRGYPYGIRDQVSPVMLHHGLWSNIPDLDGITQLANPDFRLDPCDTWNIIPTGKLFPMCIMNVAFRREMTPLMYMLLMGRDEAGDRWGYDRFDDIWGGIFVKLAADRLGYAITSGSPGVMHSRASDPHRNAELEAPGMETHERLWPYLHDVKLTGNTPGECYLELADAVAHYDGVTPRPGYWHSLATAMKIWVSQSERLLQ
jgi:hypothetical protein